MLSDWRIFFFFWKVEGGEKFRWMRCVCVCVCVCEQLHLFLPEVWQGRVVRHCLQATGSADCSHEYFTKLVCCVLSV